MNSSLGELESRLNEPISDDLKHTALGYAVACENAEAARLLVHSGADPWFTGTWPCIHEACQHVNMTMLRALSESLTDLHHVNFLEQTPLHVLCASTQEKEASEITSMVDYLLAHNVSPDAVDATGNLALHYAYRTGKIEVVRQLLPVMKTPLHPLPKNKAEQSLFHSACYSQRPECIQSVLHLFDSTDVSMGTKNSLDRLGNAPVHVLFQKKPSDPGADERVRECLQLFQRHEVDISVANRAGNYPLHLACLNCWKSCVSFLLENFICQVDIRGQRNRTPMFFVLHHLCYAEDSNDQIVLIRLLLEKGADAHVTDGDGNTLLHYASRYGLTRCIHFFVNTTHLDVNQTNQCGHTPLHIAYEQEKFDAVEYLIRLGADSTIKDNQGYNARDYGIQYQLNAHQPSYEWKRQLEGRGRKRKHLRDSSDSSEEEEEKDGTKKSRFE